MAKISFLTVLLALQTAAVQFEVASVRPRPEQPESGIETVTQFGPRQIRLAYVSLADCVSIAYRVNRDRIVGPDWMGTTRFDLAATVPSGATRQQVPEMLQSLLAQRFRLKTHRETRELPGYTLEHRSAKLESVALEAQAQDQLFTTTLNGSGAGIFVNLPNGASYALEKDRFEFKSVTMAMLADALSRFVGKPVTDATNLTGVFNIAFDAPNARLLNIRYAASVGVPVPPEPLQLANNTAGEALGMGLRRAGFSLEPRRLPVEIIVVDSIDRSPSEN